MTDDPWREIKDVIMKAAQDSLDEIIPEGGRNIWTWMRRGY